MTIKSVAIIGAGAAGKHDLCQMLPRYFGYGIIGTGIQITGAATAAAFAAEQYFETIRVFERKGSAGGTWFVALTAWLFWP